MVRSEDLQQNESLGEVLDRSAEESRGGYAVAISSAEMDHAVAIAHRYPRNITRFMRDSLTMATSNEDTAKECMYALPRKEWDRDAGKEVTKIIEGPSVRLAEIMLSAWGNVKVGSRIVETGDENVVAEGVFIDLEKNVHISRHVVRSIVGSTGKRFKGEMIKTTSNAASSIAMRNAITIGIPRALWSAVLKEVKKVIAGDAKTVDARRKDILKGLNVMGVANERIFAVLSESAGRPIEGAMDIGLDEIVTLLGLANAIKNEEISAEEAFPVIVRARAQEPDTKLPAKERDAIAEQAKQAAEARGKQSEARAEARTQQTTDATPTKLTEPTEAPAGTPASEGGLTMDEIQKAIGKATTTAELTDIVIPMIDEIQGEENRKSLHLLALRKAASLSNVASGQAEGATQSKSTGRPKEMN